MIAICIDASSIWRRHFLHCSAPVEYAIRYGNDSSIFQSYLDVVHYKKLLHKNTTIPTVTQVKNRRNNHKMSSNHDVVRRIFIG